MKCPKCGFDNYDGVLECCNCHAKLPQNNKQSKEQPPQNNIPNMAMMPPQQNLYDPNAVVVPEKKKDFKPLLAGTFVVAMLGVTGFCVWAFLAGNKDLEKKQQLLQEVPMVQENPTIAPDIVEKPDDNDALHISMDSVTETPTPTPETPTPIENENENVVVELTEVEKLENELFKDSGYIIYGDKNIAQIKIPTTEEKTKHVIYKNNAAVFWNGTQVYITSVNYKNHCLKSVFSSHVEPYKDEWAFPDERSKMKTSMINEKIVYYTDGYNQDLDMYTRIYLIPNIRAIVDSNGIYTPQEGEAKEGSCVLIAVTYPSSDMVNATKLMKLISLECSTKFDDFTLEEIEEQKNQENIVEETTN